MTTLPVPMVSQLSPLTQDHLPSENREQDCVPACLCAAIMCLLGITTVDQNWNPDRILNMAYPEGYKGGTAAEKFIQACATFGILLFSIQGDNEYLVQQVHHCVDSGYPVLCTIPDPYIDTSLPQYSGWTHVECFFQTGSGYLVALDPYPAGHPVSKSDATWASLFQFGEIWALRKAQSEENMPTTISITTLGVSDWFKEVDATHWQCLKNGCVLQGDNLDWYKNNGTVPYCGFSSMGLPLSNEIKIEEVGASVGYPYAHLAGNGIVVQYGERQNIVYDPKHEFDNPPGAGATYPTHLLGSSGINPTLWDAEAQLAKAGTPDPLTPEYKTALKSVITAVTPLIGKV